jgi:long-chain acyl-CoA synthetase
MTGYSDKPWLDSYKLGPFDLLRTMEPYPNVPLFSFLDDTASRFSQRSACLYEGRKITWSELKLYVDKLATALDDLGVKKGDKVATILPTCPQFVISEYAIQKTGAVHVPCSVLHKGPDLIYEVGESGANKIICLDTSLDIVNSIKDQTRLDTVIVTAVGDFSASEPELEEVPGTYQMRNLISMYDAEPPSVEIDPQEDLALLVFTGGATGRPKGVMLTHFNLTSNTLQLLPWVLGPLQKGIIGKSSMLIAVPFFHAYGHLAMRSAVYWGLQMILIPDPRDTDAIAESLKRIRPFMATLVPTQYMKLIDRNIGRMNVTFTSGAFPLR